MSKNWKPHTRIQYSGLPEHAQAWRRFTQHYTNKGTDEEKIRDVNLLNYTTFGGTTIEGNDQWAETRNKAADKAWNALLELAANETEDESYLNLAEALTLSLLTRKVDKPKPQKREPLSLDEARGAEKSLTGPEPVSFSAEIMTAEELHRLPALINRVLDPRSQQIVKMRFGLEGQEAMGLEAIGKHVHLTKTGVDDVVLKALAKLHDAVHSTENGEAPLNPHAKIIEERKAAQRIRQNAANKRKAERKDEFSPARG